MRIDKLGIEHLLREKYKMSNALLAAHDIRRLFKGEPLDYVIGWAPFLGCHIDLSLKPFIPRPETEYWVSEAVRSLKARGHSLRVLDMFAGSGCIGIAVLKHLPNSRVTFAEKNPQFVEQIKINLKKNGIKKSRFRVVKSEFFEKIKGRFDVIFANPPYVGAGDFIDQSVKQYEPREVWFAKKGGLAAINKFLKSARVYCKPGGEVWMEFSPVQKIAVEAMLARSGYPDFSFFRDQYKRLRYLRAGLSE